MIKKELLLRWRIPTFANLWMSVSTQVNFEQVWFPAQQPLYRENITSYQVIRTGFLCYEFYLLYAIILLVDVLAIVGCHNAQCTCKSCTFLNRQAIFITNSVTSNCSLYHFKISQSQNKPIVQSVILLILLSWVKPNSLLC